MPRSRSITTITIVLTMCSAMFSPALIADSSEPPNITFIVPDSDSGRFWSKVTKVSSAAARSLGVQLEVIYSENNRFATLQKVKELVARDNKPDYLVFRPFKGNAKSAFTLLEKHELPFATLERGFDLEDFATPIMPRIDNAFWLGQIIYDNRSAGHMLLNALIDEHNKVRKTQPINITAFGGDFDAVAKNREHALIEIKENEKYQNLTVNQIFPTNWNTDIIYQRFKNIMLRYPQTNVFWCASDNLALAVLDKVKTQPDNKYVIGGFDWMPSALEEIKNGRLTASAGGHFLMGAYQVIRLFDYHNGIDRFSQSEDIKQFELITENNIPLFYPFLKNESWRDIDFKAFSGFYSKQPRDLNIRNMIELAAE